MENLKDDTYMPSDWLRAFQKIVCSQCGEDGIIEKILEIMGEKNKWCVEFGATDGQYVSNSWSLINTKGWQSVLIEGDPQNYKKLAANYSANKNVTCVQRYVNFQGENQLDDILAQTSIPQDFDVLSIDIDGNDYHI